MGTREDGGGRLWRARRLVPVAVAGAAVAGIVGAIAARSGARRTTTAAADPERSMAGPPADRPALPARRTAPPAARRRRVAAPTPEPDIDLDVATRALTALATVDPPSTELSTGTPADEPADDRAGGNGHPARPPLPPRGTALRSVDTHAPAAVGAAPPPLRPPAPPPPPARAPDPFPTPDAPPAPAPSPVVPPGAAPPSPSTPPTAPTAPPSPGPGPGRLAGYVSDVRRHRARLVAGVVVVAIGIGASAAIAGVGSDDADSRTQAAPTTTERSTTTSTLPAPSPDTVFAGAADRLVRAGSFTYTGTVSATDVSLVRPMLWLGVESTVTGEVDLDLGRVHEVALAADERASETVTDGPAVWSRRTSDAEALPDAAFQAVPELSDPDDAPPARGAALLPIWLAAAVDPTDLGSDASGRPTFAARVPAEVLGPVERAARAVDGLITVSVDDEGTPQWIELVTVDEPRFRLTIDLTAVGGAVAIEPPGPVPAT